MSDKFKNVKDEETRKLLEEMEEDGEETPEFKPKNEEPADDKAEETDGDDTADKEKSKSDDEEDTADSEEEEEEEEEESESDDDVESEDDDEPPTDQAAWKFTKMKKEFKRLYKKLDAILNSESESKSEKSEEIEKALNDYATRNKVPVEEVKELFSIFQKSSVNPEVQALLKERKEKKFWEDQDQKFDKDFTQNLLPILKRDMPDATEEQLNEMYNSVYELAFYEPKNKTKGLVEIYFDSKMKPKIRKVTGENSKNSFPTFGKVKSIDDLSEDDIDEMSDEDFDKFSENIAKKTKPRIVHH